MNIKIGIVQKVYEGPGWYFAIMILQSGDHFGKRTAWSLIYYLNYAYFDIYPSLLIYETPSNLYIIHWNALCLINFLLTKSMSVVKVFFFLFLHFLFFFYNVVVITYVGTTSLITLMESIFIFNKIIYQL